MHWVFYIYAGIGLVSFILLIIMTILGGLDLGFEGGGLDLDMDGDVDIAIGVGDGGPGLFSIPVLLGFTTAFGSVAALLTYFDVGVILSPLIAIVVSIVVAIVLFMIVSYMFKHFSSDSTLKFENFIGKKASVTVPIKPGQEGQVVLFTEQRGRTIIPAVSDKEIPNNAQVVITGMSGDAVKVITLSEWRKKNKNKAEKGRSKNPGHKKR
ncbi:MAG: NfeD family protein [Thermoplasmatota archaeon]